MMDTINLMSRNHVAVYKVDGDGRQRVPYLEAEGMKEGKVIILERELLPEEELIIRKHHSLHQKGEYGFGDEHVISEGELSVDANESLREYEELMRKLRESGVIKSRT